MIANRPSPVRSAAMPRLSGCPPMPASLYLQACGERPPLAGDCCVFCSYGSCRACQSNRRMLPDRCVSGRSTARGCPDWPTRRSRQSAIWPRLQLGLARCISFRKSVRRLILPSMSLHGGARQVDPAALPVGPSTTQRCRMDSMLKPPRAWRIKARRRACPAE